MCSLDGIEGQHFHSIQLTLSCLLVALCVWDAWAGPALQQRHLEFEGSMYQDYGSLNSKSSIRARTIHSMSVKMLKTRSFRMPVFESIVQMLDKNHTGQKCISGQATPEPAALRCKGFHAYNPTVLALGDAQGLLMMARISNWSLCSWTGQGRPYADWPEKRWPDAVFEEYHSHMAVTRISESQLLEVSSSSMESQTAQLVSLDGEVWARTRAPFFEIFRQGLEDPRLLMLRGGIRALVVYGKRGARKESTRLTDARVETVGAFRQALVTLDGIVTPDDPTAIKMEDFVPLETNFDRDSQQKNWMPFVFMDTVYVIYKLTPQMKVLVLDEGLGSAILSHETASDPALIALQHADVRGGSQCVHVLEEGLYLGVAHVSRGRAMYTHFFFAFRDKPPFDMLGVSREWCLAHEETFESGKETLCEGVQFVSGLALLRGNSTLSGGSGRQGSTAHLVISYGVMDCDARVATMKLQSALNAIRFRTRPTGGAAGAKQEL